MVRNATSPPIRSSPGYPRTVNPLSRIVLVTPALADANNGNWQTAQRWARMLRKAYRVRVATEWTGGDDDLLIALHARRSAASVARWKAARPGAPVIVVLTGTDLYRDIASDAGAQAALVAANRLVVLNALGANALPMPLRPKVDVVLQSTPARRVLAKSPQLLRALAVGHLRDEKSPRTLFDAVRLLAARDDLRVDHVGAALDETLGTEARALMAVCPHYRWLGGLPHGDARARIQRAHVLVHPSRIEGGAHVVIESIRSGTAVLASRIDGNVGLLGDDYAGYFPVGDAGALADILVRLRDDPAMLPLLQHQCAARSGAFDPTIEAAALKALIARAMPLSSFRARP